MAVRLRVTWDRGRSATVRAERGWPTEELKRAIAECTGFPPEEQRLFYEDRRKGAVELPEAEPLSVLRGYAGDLTLVRCYPRQAEWHKRVALDWEVLEVVPKALQADREVVLAALRQSGGALRFASGGLRGDRQLVHLAVQTNPEALEFAAEALRADWEIVVAAMEQDCGAFRFAAEALRGDRELALGAVERSGALLEFVTEALRADRDLVLAALQENGAALRFAADALRGDREVVLAAVRENPYALEFAAEGFVADQEILRAALGDENVCGGAAGGEKPPEKKVLPDAYPRWMGFQAPAPEPQPEPPGADEDRRRGAGPEEEEDLDEGQRLDLAVHWRLEPEGGLVHRWDPELRIQPLPCCDGCRFGRHLWCPTCGPVAMPEAGEATRDLAAMDPGRVRAERLKVRKFLGAGLAFTAADLRACAFKGVPA